MFIIILKFFLSFGLMIKIIKEISIDNHKINLTQGSCWAVPSTCVKNISNLEIRKKIILFFYLVK